MKIEKIGTVLAGLINLGCICELTRIGLKRNNECYKAEMQALQAECRAMALEIDNAVKDAKIKQLEDELKELKN